MIGAFVPKYWEAMQLRARVKINVSESQHFVVFLGEWSADRKDTGII